MTVKQVKEKIDSLLASGQISEDDEVIHLEDEFCEYFVLGDGSIRPIDMTEEIAELEKDIVRAKQSGLVGVYNSRVRRKMKYEQYFTKRCLAIC